MHFLLLFKEDMMRNVQSVTVYLLRPYSQIHFKMIQLMYFLIHVCI